MQYCSDICIELIIENDLLIGSVFNFGPTAIFKKSLKKFTTHQNNSFEWSMPICKSHYFLSLVRRYVTNLNISAQIKTHGPYS